jgi:hypothetical protein
MIIKAFLRHNGPVNLSPDLQEEEINGVAL